MYFNLNKGFLMSEDRFYPPLNEDSIHLVLELLDNDPEYLSDAACPYSQRIKDLFHKSPLNPDFDPSSELLGSDEFTEEDVTKQISSLYRELKKFGTEAQFSENASDKSTYFRVAVSLLERLIKLKEQSSRLAKHNDFVYAILSVMEEVLNADQIAEVQDRLERFDVALNTKHTDNEEGEK